MTRNGLRKDKLDSIICPKCGAENPAGVGNCKNCRINLRFALEHPEQIGGANPERISQAASPEGARSSLTIVGVVVMSILSLVIGLFGIAVLIGVGEGTNNAIYAFLAVSIPFALLAGFFSWLLPEAQWAVALVMPAPVASLCQMGASMGGIYLLGMIWTVACTIAGASLGTRLRRPR